MEKVLTDFSILVNNRKIIAMGNKNEVQDVMNERQNIDDYKYNFVKSDLFDFYCTVDESEIKRLVNKGYIRKEEE